MTPKQKLLLDEILRYRREHGVSPTIDELRRHFGYASKSGVHARIDALVRDGHLVRSPGTNRGLRPASDGPPRPARGACAGEPTDAVTTAAFRLLANLAHEDFNRGLAQVRVDDLGDLDIALAEAGAYGRGNAPPPPWGWAPDRQHPKGGAG